MFFVGFSFQLYYWIYVIISEKISYCCCLLCIWCYKSNYTQLCTNTIARIYVKSYVGLGGPYNSILLRAKLIALQIAWIIWRQLCYILQTWDPPPGPQQEANRGTHNTHIFISLWRKRESHKFLILLSWDGKNDPKSGSKTLSTAPSYLYRKSAHTMIGCLAGNKWL